MRDYFNDREYDSKLEEKVEAFPFWRYCMSTVDDEGTRCKLRKVWSDTKGELVCPNSNHKRALTIYDIRQSEIHCISCFLITSVDSKECVHCMRTIKQFTCDVCNAVYVNTAKLTGKNAHCMEGR